MSKILEMCKSMKWQKSFLLGLLACAICLFYNPVLAISPSIHSNQNADLIQAQKLYENGRYVEASQILKRAQAVYKTAGDELNQAMSLSNLSLVYQQLGNPSSAQEVILQSLAILSSSKKINNLQAKWQIIAQSLDIQAKLKLAQGQTEDALKLWQEAGDIYLKLGDETALISNRINQAQAMQSLGLFRKANAALELVKASLEKETLPDSNLKAIGLRSLGNIYRAIGNFDDSKEYLNKSIAVALKINNHQALSDAYLSLGNTYRSMIDALLTVGSEYDTQRTLQYTQEAIKNYNLAFNNASASVTTRLNGMLNLLKLFADVKNNDNIGELLSNIQSLIVELPHGRAAIYSRINFADTLLKFANDKQEKQKIIQIAFQQLQEALKQARELVDKRAESYVLGVLGELYENAGQLDDAERLSKKALAISESIDAKDIGYQWQWQLGRLENKRGNKKNAIDAYGLAIKTLDLLRKDLVTVNTDVQFSFREKVEPVYREYVNLLLQDKERNNLLTARKILESLQIAELNNFFRVACLKPVVNIDAEVDKKETSTAIIYPIILPDRVEIILKLPNTREIGYSSRFSEKKLEKIVEQLREDITEKKVISDIKSLQVIYDMLLKPAEVHLQKSRVNTLVFVLDGVLRNVPIAALYDGQKYLIEKYSVAVSPTLQLFELQKIAKSKALIAGLSEESKNFPKLEYVRKELDDIKSVISLHKELFNQNFTKNNLENKLNSQPFSIVHIATHGQFSSDPNETFILGYNNEKIKLNDLKQWLRKREELKPDAIELLVLSACETASSDKRAALGIAGVAIQAGARSTVASLWNVNDESTAALMSKFYQEFAANNVSKAEALRLAQLALWEKDKEYKKPYYWAPFILIGNWL